MTKEQLEKITKVLSNPSTIEWFKKTYGEDFMKYNCRNGRLRFDMGISWGDSCESRRRIISYNNDIINLFFNDPDYCKGFSNYTGKYPVTSSCWKGNMYIQCLDQVIDDLGGYGTRHIIGMILGYEKFPRQY